MLNPSNPSQCFSDVLSPTATAPMIGEGGVESKAKESGSSLRRVGAAGAKEESSSRAIVVVAGLLQCGVQRVASVFGMWKMRRLDIFGVLNWRGVFFSDALSVTRDGGKTHFTHRKPEPQSHLPLSTGDRDSGSWVLGGRVRAQKLRAPTTDLHLLSHTRASGQRRRRLTQHHSDPWRETWVALSKRVRGVASAPTIAGDRHFV